MERGVNSFSQKRLPVPDALLIVLGADGPAASSLSPSLCTPWRHRACLTDRQGLDRNFGEGVQVGSQGEAWVARGCRRGSGSVGERCLAREVSKWTWLSQGKRVQGVCVCVGWGLLATLKRDGILMSWSVSSHQSQMSCCLRERDDEQLLTQTLKSNNYYNKTT